MNEAKWLYIFVIFTLTMKVGRASFIAFCVLRTSKDNEKHFVLILFREQRYLAATDYIIMVNKQDKILKDTR